MSDILYRLVYETPERELSIDWGNSPDWQTTYADIISQARRLSLIPKVEGLPVVSLQGGPFNVFSRTHGRTDTEQRVRVYCAQNGLQVPLWIYPNGTIEQANMPSYVGLFFETDKQD